MGYFGKRHGGILFSIPVIFKFKELTDVTTFNFYVSIFEVFVFVVCVWDIFLFYCSV